MRWVSTTTTITSISTRLCTSSVTSLCTTCACAMTWCRSAWRPRPKITSTSCAFQDALGIVGEMMRQVDGRCVQLVNAISENEELMGREPKLEVYLSTMVSCIVGPSKPNTMASNSKTPMCLVNLSIRILTHFSTSERTKFPNLFCLSRTWNR